MRFEVWAPFARDRVVLLLDGRGDGQGDGGGNAGGTGDTDVPMAPDPDRPGWWAAEAPAVDGTRYAFALDGGPPLPDPRSRRLPDGPDGPSAVFLPDTHVWRHEPPERGLRGAVLYELHIGTWTPEGTLDAATAHLGDLAELGITQVELLPLCPFPGVHNWGYDGVAPWAVHEPYGGPAALKRFVDAAHGHGLGVVLDVVHNHLGPSGNHLPAYGPYLTDAHRTPWGPAVNLDGPGSDEVREYLLGSALRWLREFRIDGLRLDAVHALADDRALTFLEELSAAVDRLGSELGRPLFLIAESDRNDPRTTTPRAAGGLGLHAQWNDDFHHGLHTLLTGESQGYYADFAADPRAALARSLTRVWFHDGTYSSFRGRTHGRPVDPAVTPVHRFVGFAQSHDQIGNRAAGDRLSALLSPGLLACAAALVLTGPFTPMLFMGEEWGAGTPWQYFTDHTDPETARRVREGRRGEFAAHGWSAGEVPDPQDPATRDRSVLDRSERTREPHARLLAWHRELIALRHARPDLTDPDPATVDVSYDSPGGTSGGTAGGTGGGAEHGTDVSAGGGTDGGDGRPDRFVVRRGELRILYNLGRSPAGFPVGSGARVLASWDPSPGPDAAGELVLGPESCAVVLAP